MKPDEWNLLRELFSRTDIHEHVRKIGARLGMHPKRVIYLCEKWAGRDWYDYGVAADLGWLTDKGRLAALQEAARRNDAEREFPVQENGAK